MLVALLWFDTHNQCWLRMPGLTLKLKHTPSIACSDGDEAPAVRQLYHQWLGILFTPSVSTVRRQVLFLVSVQPFATTLLECPFSFPLLQGTGRSSSRLGLSAGFQGCKRHPIPSGHRDNFGKPRKEPWDAAKPDGHAAPSHKS